MAKRKADPKMFAGLTYDESWVLDAKLMSGATAAGMYGVGDHDTAMEIWDVSKDVQANWKKNRK
jgi:hypothetical protein